MNSPFHINRKVRLVFSKLGSLLLLFQRTPIVQMILPEARVMSTTGVVDLVKWSVATVAGLGAFDTVAGATTIAQIAPTPVVNPVPATTGVAFSMTVQASSPKGNPGSWSITVGSLPPGIVKSAVSSICTLSGIPTAAGSYNFTLTAWENSNFSGGSISKAFTISVAQGAIAPAITTNPASTTVNSGSTATLTVAASGTSPTFQWYKGNAGVTTAPVSGATSASFTTPALTANTTYWAKASNSVGSANSAAATVTVRIPPAITTQPVSTTIASGTTATLTVAASGTTPTFQWYLGNSGVTTSPVSGATSASFTPPNLTATTSYWVRASNAAGTANSNTATVAVEIPPVITTQPASTTIASGGTTTLNVGVSGTAPIYQWYTGSPGDYNNPIDGATSPTFTTPALTATTSYWVEIYNNVGFEDSVAATVTVMTPPAITTSPASSTATSGSTVTLNVAASGTSPTFQWYLGNSGDIGNPVSGATGASFVTPAITATTSFWVRANNAVGHADSATAVISVASGGSFSSWQNSQFSPAQLADPLVSGPTADPDGDGMTNQQEYVFGALPLTANPAAAAIGSNAGQMVISFTAKAATGPGYDGKTRHYALESADTLNSGATWTSPSGFADIIASGQTVNYNITPAPASQFYHLKVWLTP